MWYEAWDVVAFAGVHGAYGELTTLLRSGGVVVDTGLCWSGGKTHLVSLGDLRYVDPGEYAAYAPEEGPAEPAPADPGP